MVEAENERMQQFMDANGVKDFRKLNVSIQHHLHALVLHAIILLTSSRARPSLIQSTS